MHIDDFAKKRMARHGLKKEDVERAIINPISSYPNGPNTVHVAALPDNQQFKVKFRTSHNGTHTVVDAFKFHSGRDQR